MVVEWLKDYIENPLKRRAQTTSRTNNRLNKFGKPSMEGINKRLIDSGVTDKRPFSGEGRDRHPFLLRSPGVLWQRLVV